jgi:regulation of enolase protein 1 (concanavalin A-like superfamily)
MSAIVEVPALPAPLRWVNTADAWSARADALVITAGPRTDWFVDPLGDSVVDNAPALLMATEGTWMLRALVSAEHAARFDAGVLAVWAGPKTWAKLCLELAPDGRLMVVSVVTRGESDDCNSVAVEGDAAWLRISRLGRAFAFHWSSDGDRWHMVRYFGLGSAADAEVGFLAQSPTGAGCTATFEHIHYSPERLADVRSGL